MMDPKLMEILKKAKAIDTAAAEKSGEKRTPTRKSNQVNKNYFDSPDTQYLTAEQVEGKNIPTPSSSGGLFDQIGVTEQPSMGSITAPVVDRINVNSPAYNDSVKKSKLPEAIQRAMLENPIPQPDGLLGGVPEEFIREINPQINEGYNNEDDFYENPTQPSVKSREIPRTQPSSGQDFNESEIRKMIAQEIAKALPTIVENYFDKRVIKENVQFKAGETTFSGTVSPLPKKKRTKKNI